MTIRQQSVSRRTALMAGAGVVGGMGLGLGGTAHASPFGNPRTPTPTGMPAQQAVASNLGFIAFSQLPGATDDAKIDAYLSTISAQTYKPPCFFDEPRAYTWTTKHGLCAGARFVGMALGPVDQARSSMPLPQVFQLRLPSSGGVFTLPDGSDFSVSFECMSFDANAKSYLIQQNSNAVGWTSTFRNLSYQNGPGLLGTSSAAQPMDACTFTGDFCNLNNIRDVAFNIAGSDCSINPDVMLIDSPPTFMGPTGVLVRLSWFSKSPVRNLYITADQHSAMFITGSNESIELDTCQFEGRNANKPCYGALVRISSDITMSHCWTSYAMSNPSATGRDDGGVLHFFGSGSSGLVTGNTYRLATGVAPSTPYIFVAPGSTGHLIVRDLRGKDTAGAYFAPVVRNLSDPKNSSGNFVIDYDRTVEYKNT